jgi:hypothetical protein
MLVIGRQQIATKRDDRRPSVFSGSERPATRPDQSGPHRDEHKLTRRGLGQRHVVVHSGAYCESTLI